MCVHKAAMLTVVSIEGLPGGCQAEVLKCLLSRGQLHRDAGDACGVLAELLRHVHEIRSALAGGGGGGVLFQSSWLFSGHSSIARLLHDLRAELCLGLAFSHVLVWCSEDPHACYERLLESGVSCIGMADLRAMGSEASVAVETLASTRPKGTVTTVCVPCPPYAADTPHSIACVASRVCEALKALSTAGASPPHHGFQETASRWHPVEPGARGRAVVGAVPAAR